MVFAIMLRCGISGIFLVSGWQKLRDLAAFRQAVLSFQFVPPATVTLITGIVPWSEVLLASALLWGLLSLTVALLLAMLLTIFSAALAFAWLRGERVTCGCFGEREEPTSYPRSLLRNGALLLSLVALIVIMHGRAEAITIAQELAALGSITAVMVALLFTHWPLFRLRFLTISA